MFIFTKKIKMKKILYLIVVVLFISCNEQDEVCECSCDETCGKILDRDRPISSNYTYWEVELICSGEIFTHRTRSTSLPERGAIICKDDWNRY